MSMLKKKWNAIAYHAICKLMAMRESLKGHVRSADSPADLTTKIVTWQKRQHLVSLVLHGIYDEDT